MIFTSLTKGKASSETGNRTEGQEAQPVKREASASCWASEAECSSEVEDGLCHLGLGRPRYGSQNLRMTHLTS